MEDDIIHRGSPVFRELIDGIDGMIQTVGDVSQTFKPMICGERYLTGDEVCRTFHLSVRTLQDYRDNKVIPYTMIGGKMLYPESEIEKLLDQNHVDARGH